LSIKDLPQEPGEIYKLDLEKYGLTYLDNKNLLSLNSDDMDKLLNALGKDDISLNIPITCTPGNTEWILSFSGCRRCGDCCIPNPLYPDSPGVEVFKEEFGPITGHLQISEETLKEMTSLGKVAPHPFHMTRLTFTRWLPLPCPFYIEERNICRIYPVRPVVCKVHPIIFTGDDSYLAIKLHCDYGKELVKSVFKYVRENDPEYEIIL